MLKEKERKTRRAVMDDMGVGGHVVVHCSAMKPLLSYQPRTDIQSQDATLSLLWGPARGGKITTNGSALEAETRRLSKIYVIQRLYPHYANNYQSSSPCRGVQASPVKPPPSTGAMIWVASSPKVGQGRRSAEGLNGRGGESRVGGQSGSDARIHETSSMSSSSSSSS